MRIEPKREVLTAQQPTTSAEEADGFADALASAQGSFSETPSIADDAANAGKAPPLAQRWGQYGLGATKAGFGTPNPDLYSDAPVGANAPASPLNPGGETTTPSFVVSGYTGRGTPVPPGFYNIAYYNMYLEQGGTPLVGFPQMEDGSTLSATYGTFGDGAERATSYLTGFVDDTPDAPAPDTSAAAAQTASADTSTTIASALAALVNAAAAKSGGSATETAASAATASDTAAPATTPPAAAAVTAVAAATTPAAAGGDTPGSTAAASSAPPASGSDLLRTELAALLNDLLRSA
ncbi:MAG TPA: hypothetical protein VGK30_16875 [Candidatus Binatia bacterium]